MTTSAAARTFTLGTRWFPRARLRLPRWSLARQFLVVHFAFVLIGVVLTGAWIGDQIESSVLNRTAGMTALYVDSVIGPHLQTLSNASWLTPNDLTDLDRMLSDSGLGQGVVVFKIWSTDGHVLYSPDRSLIGRQFAILGGLQPALAGQVSAEMSVLDEPENEHERQHWSRLLEVYAPVRRDLDGQVVGVIEFYLQPDALDAEIADARLRAWAVVGVFGGVLYLLTAGIMQRGSNTIKRQQSRLEQQVEELALLHERMLQSANRYTALNEESLRRISADLHDGPAQVLALALMRLDSLSIAGTDQTNFSIVHDAVRDALKDVRGISSGLRLPELEPLALPYILERAVSDHERRSGVKVDRDMHGLPSHAPLAVKIALLRTVQEALSNAARHASGIGVAVSARTSHGRLVLEVSDRGPGFDTHVPVPAGHLGLPGMRERAELLGGSFDVSSTPGAGTTLRACWPLLEHTAA